MFSLFCIQQLLFLHYYSIPLGSLSTIFCGFVKTRLKALLPNLPNSLHSEMLFPSVVSSGNQATSVHVQYQVGASLRHLLLTYSKRSWTWIFFIFLFINVLFFYTGFIHVWLSDRRCLTFVFVALEKKCLTDGLWLYNWSYRLFFSQGWPFS